MTAPTALTRSVVSLERAVVTGITHIPYGQPHRYKLHIRLLDERDNPSGEELLAPLETRHERTMGALIGQNIEILYNPQGAQPDNHSQNTRVLGAKTAEGYVISDNTGVIELPEGYSQRRLQDMLYIVRQSSGLSSYRLMKRQIWGKTRRRL